MALVLTGWGLAASGVLPDQALIGPKTEPAALGSYQQILYVSAEAGDDEQGDGSRKKPWRSVIRALQSARESSKGLSSAVLVSEGLYDQDTIVMKPGVALLGGFSKESWERDIEAYRSVLSGAGVRRVVIGADNALIDGFRITQGCALGHGGGILCEDTSPAISNNFVVDNRTMEPQELKYSRIHQPGYDGGGIACLFNAHPVIRNNVIAGNRTGVGNGGGVTFYGWIRPADLPVPELKYNVIVGNVAGSTDRNRTRSSSGGGIFCAYETAPRIEGNIIAMNQALGRSDAGGIFCEYVAKPRIINNWVVGNRGDDDGGGLYTMRLSEPVVEGNVFMGNWAPGVGGIRVSKEGRAIVRDNLVARNTHGGVLIRDGYMVAERNVIIENKEGPGIAYRQDYPYFAASIFEQNIVWGNSEPGIVLDKMAGPAPEIRGCMVEGEDGDSGRNPNLPQDGGSGAISGISYCDDTRTTTLTGDLPDCVAPGRVLFLGDQSSVVKSSDDRQVVVYGQLTVDQAAGRIERFEIAPTYGFK